GALPYWELLRRHPGAQGALKGMNAVVVGILLAAFYHPVWTKAIHSPLDFSLALAAFGLLAYWKAPAWLVVGISALGGLAISVLGRTGCNARVNRLQPGWISRNVPPGRPQPPGVDRLGFRGSAGPP